MKWMYVVLLAFSASVCAAGDPLWVAYGNGRLEIAPDGSVAEVMLEQPFGTAIERVVAGRMRQWKFEPIVDNGRPVRAIAHMHFRLHARLGKTDETTRLAITDVLFVDPPGTPRTDISIDPPRYPQRMIGSRLGADLVIRAEIAADGTVARAALQRGQLLYAGRVSNERRRLDEFADASLQAVQAGRFTASVDGRARIVDLPFTFTVVRRGDKSPWHRAHPVAVVPEPWAADAQTVVGHAAGGAVQDPRMRLLTPMEAVPEA